MLEEKDLRDIQTMIDTSVSDAITGSEARMNAKMDERFAQFEKKMDEKIAASENRMQAYFEAAIMPKFDLLLDAFQSITETCAPLKRVEKLEEDVTYLKSDVRELSREVRALKKAQ